MPGLEAHGGYTFCGTAAMVILGKEHMLDLKALLVSTLPSTHMALQLYTFSHMGWVGWPTKNTFAPVFFF